MGRLFDILFATIILIFFLPFGIVIAFLIAFGSKGGVFYSQKRVGKNRFEFDLLKFRSMRPMADQSGKLTVGMRDPRITNIGYFLRKYKLDEFPQFLNVLKGDMSIVGPRPEVMEYVRHYNMEQMKVLNVKPGITDYASLHYFNENELLGNSDNPEKTYIEKVMPAKLNLNYQYILEKSFLTDVKIMWRTFLKIVS
jgi:lipopolysaccharide/colanic/teichoic acid biosynthesis glycosyltransferase